MINKNTDLQLVHHVALIVTQLHAVADGLEQSILNGDIKINTNEQLIAHVLHHIAQLNVVITSNVSIMSATLNGPDNEDDEYESFGITSYEW